MTSKQSFFGLVTNSVVTVERIICRFPHGWEMSRRLSPVHTHRQEAHLQALFCGDPSFRYYRVTFNSCPFLGLFSDMTCGSSMMKSGRRKCFFIGTANLEDVFLAKIIFHD